MAALLTIILQNKTHNANSIHEKSITVNRKTTYSTFNCKPVKQLSSISVGFAKIKTGVNFFVWWYD